MVGVTLPGLGASWSVCFVSWTNTHSPCDVTDPWNLTTTSFLHNKGELLVHLSHPWVHYKHAATETMSHGLIMSQPLSKRYALASGKRQCDLLLRAGFAGESGGNLWWRWQRQLKWDKNSDSHPLYMHSASLFTKGSRTSCPTWLSPQYCEVGRSRITIPIYSRRTLRSTEAKGSFRITKLVNRTAERRI